MRVVMQFLSIFCSILHVVYWCTSCIFCRNDFVLLVSVECCRHSDNAWWRLL